MPRDRLFDKLAWTAVGVPPTVHSAGWTRHHSAYGKKPPLLQARERGSLTKRRSTAYHGPTN